MTMLAIVWPGVKFRFDALGRAAPVGHTVTKLGADGLVTVTFNATVPTPDAGTPPRPVTERFNVWPGPTLPTPANSPSTVAAPARVSNRRAGTSDVYPASVGNQ